MSNLFKAKELEVVRESYILRFRSIYESIKEDSSGRKLWPLSKFHYGHGKYTVLNKDGSKKTYRAHRLSYLVYVGDIPEGFCVRHKNDCPEDVNVSNLEVGTLAENNKDRKTRNRSNYVVEPAHEKCRRFSSDEVIQMRKAYEEGSTIGELARLYDVDRSSISKIVNHLAYKHVK